MVPSEVQGYDEGSFYKQDTVDKLELITEDEHEIGHSVMKVTWKQRLNNNIIPQPSYSSYNLVKKYQPFKLIELWETVYTTNNVKI